MRAELLDECFVLDETVFVEVRIWRMLRPVRGSAYGVKYSMALMADRVCVLRYDSEAGKRGHRHAAGGAREPYAYRGVDGLLADFWTEVDASMAGRER